MNPSTERAEYEAVKWARPAGMAEAMHKIAPEPAIEINQNAAVPGDPFWNGFLSGIGACGALGAITVANLYAGVAVFAVGLGFVVGVSIMKRVHQVRSAK